MSNCNFTTSPSAHFHEHYGLCAQSMGGQGVSVSLYACVFFEVQRGHRSQSLSATVIILHLNMSGNSSLNSKILYVPKNIIAVHLHLRGAFSSWEWEGAELHWLMTACCSWSANPSDQKFQKGCGDTNWAFAFSQSRNYINYIFF